MNLTVNGSVMSEGDLAWSVYNTLMRMSNGMPSLWAARG